MTRLSEVTVTRFSLDALSRAANEEAQRKRSSCCWPGDCSRAVGLYLPILESTGAFRLDHAQTRTWAGSCGGVIGRKSLAPYRDCLGRGEPGNGVDARSEVVSIGAT